MLKKFYPTLYRSLLLIWGAIAFGVVGYMLLEGYSFVDALYMTIITISTVGFTEVHPLDMGGKVFTMVLIVTDLGIFAFSITSITSYLLDGNFLKRYRENTMKDRIDRLQGHVIICGFGRNGSESAGVLRRFGLPYVVIEKNPQIIASIEGQELYIAADATTDEVLREAGIARAKALITTLPDDADNVFVVLSARELRQDITIISRATQAGSVRKLKTAGATNVIMPDRISGAYMATLVVNPDIMEFIDILSGNIENQGRIEEISLSGNKLSIEGRSLADLNLRSNTGINVIGVKQEDGSYVINPDEHFTLRSGHKLIVLGTEEQFNRLYRFIR